MSEEAAAGGQTTSRDTCPWPARAHTRAHTGLSGSRLRGSQLLSVAGQQLPDSGPGAVCPGRFPARPEDWPWNCVADGPHTWPHTWPAHLAGHALLPAVAKGLSV